ncbi:MAG: polysaccharide deacetylase family protein [Bacillota bacterium]
MKFTKRKLRIPKISIIKTKRTTRPPTIKKKWIVTTLAVAIALCGTATLLQKAPSQAKAVTNLSTAQTDRQLPIYCVETEEKKVSISFDAAWGADDTDELLRILADNNVTTTFFLCGYWVEQYPEEVKKIAEAGHDIGNHSSTHPHMNELSADQITKELMECHEAVKDLTGIEMDLFRPPFGEYNNTVVETSFANGYYPVQWDVEMRHTKKKKADSYSIEISL